MFDSKLLHIPGIKGSIGSNVHRKVVKCQGTLLGERTKRGGISFIEWLGLFGGGG
jgi:hypothetical protein